MTDEAKLIKPAGDAGEREAQRAPVLLEKVLRRAGPVLGIVSFGLALWLLQRSLSGHRYADLVAAARLPASSLALSLALTLTGYAVLMGYDVLGFRFIGRPPAWRSMATASFVSNALGNNLGNILVTGAAVRYWIYSSIGLSALQTTRVVAFCSLGFWLGILFLSATVFVAAPLGSAPAAHLLGITTTMLSVASATVLSGYLVLVALHWRPRLAAWRFELPALRLTLGQISVATLDLCLMAAALFVLLPSGTGLGYVEFLAAFLLALLAGVTSQVPGGLGVFETVMLSLLSPRVPLPDLAAALLAFRAIYFVLPLFAAVAFLALRSAPGWGGWLRQRSHALTVLSPQILAVATFVCGAVLLFSGALPAAEGRLQVLDSLLALPLIEGSHFIASLVGVVLLPLARGLQRRLEAAWLLAAVLLALGALLSLTKGGDVEEALVLGVALAALLPLRGQFYRRSSLFAEPLGGGWLVSMAMVVAAAAWLSRFAYAHADLADETWWTFALHAEAARSARASVGAMAIGGLMALHRLIVAPRGSARPPSVQDLERARPIVERSVWTYANLVYRGDKSILFSEAGDAFVMYARQGRSWIAMGDPVGPDAGVQELAWRLRELADRHDGWCAFFEVRPERRALYASLGLSLTPLGQEARVELSSFCIDQPAHKGLRYARAKLTRLGFQFEVLPREAVPQALPALAKVSAAWLAGKTTREKGFSNASFDAAYLMHFPVAVVRRGEEIVAFANVWLGAGKQELSIDLMRHLPEAPNGTMDVLFCELMLWGRAQGFGWFNLGVAPLYGVASDDSSARLWRHAAQLLARHGEHFYNFRGLQRYKAKFQPVWTMLYLASPAGLALPQVLLDVATLTAGGVLGIVAKGQGAHAATHSRAHGRAPALRHDGTSA